MLVDDLGKRPRGINWPSWQSDADGSVDVDDGTDQGRFAPPHWLGLCLIRLQRNQRSARHINGQPQSERTGENAIPHPWNNRHRSPAWRNLVGCKDTPQSLASGERSAKTNGDNTRVGAATVEPELATWPEPPQRKALRNGERGTSRRSKERKPRQKMRTADGADTDKANTVEPSPSGQRPIHDSMAGRSQE
ncbi:hypothetical protein R1flu_023635 [Riccia fluitans]|uniref:Uncharacterized protein n=1 Tax=Riccia fluitans TaxID=41844 RepID=A0ABD1XTE5_9MARC